MHLHTSRLALARGGVLLLAGLALAAPSAAAQQYAPPDSSQLAASAARASLTYWEANTNGSAEISVFLRNNADRPIQVTWYEIKDCVNVSRKLCGRHDPGPLIKPGKTVRLVSVPRERPHESWSYTWAFEARWGDDPADPLARRRGSGNRPMLLDDPACRDRPADTATIFDPDELDSPVRLLQLVPVETYALHDQQDEHPAAVLAFVIGKDGRVEDCSVRLMQQSSPAWAEASVRALADEMFSIPTRDSRPVRTQLSQRFTYQGKP